MPDGSAQGVGGPARRRKELGPLLTVREVAAKLNLSRATVYRLVDEGKLSSVWIDTSIRIPVSSVERLVAAERE